MNPQSDSTIQTQMPVSIPQPKIQKPFNWKMSFFAVLVVLIITILGSGFMYFIYLNSPRPQVNQTTNQTTASAQPSNTPLSADTWVSTPTTFMGNYTFQYPLGWHIANQWPNNSPDGITIFLDPNPLNFAPRGGPISALRMTDTSGKDNPDDLFLTERTKYKAGLTSEQEEVLTADFGSIYHYWGKIDVYNTMVDTEGYFFQIQGGPNDLINKHNIFATTDANSKYSDILKKIVVSFKKIQ